MALTPEQRKIIERSQRVADKRGSSARERKALLLAESVESNFKHLPYGDRDSVGVLQQRPSQGWGPKGESVERDVQQFLERAEAINRKGFRGSAGQLAQAVQRSAFPERYDQRSGQVEALLGGKSGRGSAASTQTRTVGGVDNSSARRQAIAQFVMGSSKDALDLALALQPLKDVPGETVTETTRGGSGGSPDTSRVAKRADAISQQKLPYKWGGGHQPGGAKPGEPLDCSGAVSKALGINPRVSGEFQSWGQAGRAPGGKGTTVYSNSKHVLMEVNGRFWGTSASNPGGGAGWIPRSQISPEYLQGFTARHA